MGSEVIIMPILLLVIFGVFYLFISSRHKERIALIEKGADASIFYSNTKANSERITPLWKIIINNIALLFLAIGLGLFLVSFFNYSLGVVDYVAYPWSIFSFLGIGLVIWIYINKILYLQKLVFPGLVNVFLFLMLIELFCSIFILFSY